MEPTYNPKIFVLDDDADDLADIKTMLTSKGYNRSEFFQDDQKFLDKLDDSVDMIIMDFYLKGRTAMDVIEKMKAKNSSARLILISGRYDQDLMLELWNVGYGNTSRIVRKAGKTFLDKVIRYINEHVQNFKEFQRELYELKNTRIADVISADTPSGTT